MQGGAWATSQQFLDAARHDRKLCAKSDSLLTTCVAWCAGGWPKLPVHNHSYACRVFPNVVPAVHTTLNVSFVSCDINPVGNVSGDGTASCKNWGPPDALPEHAATAINHGGAGGTASHVPYIHSDGSA